MTEGAVRAGLTYHTNRKGHGMKRWTRGAMLAYLLDARAITATSRQMGHGPEWLGRVLRHDPEGVLSRGEAHAILDAHEAATNGVPT